jgi:hypothetical protein
MIPRTPLRAAPIPIRPVAVSQMTCLSVVGLAPRQFLDLLGAHREIPRARLGRLRVVRVADLEAAIDRLSASGQPAPEADELDDEAPATVDAMLERLGRRRAGGER